MKTARHLLADFLVTVAEYLHALSEAIRPYVTRAEVYEHLARDPDQRGRG